MAGARVTCHFVKWSHVSRDHLAVCLLGGSVLSVMCRYARISSSSRFNSRIVDPSISIRLPRHSFYQALIVPDDSLDILIVSIIYIKEQPYHQLLSFRCRKMYRYLTRHDDAICVGKNIERFECIECGPLNFISSRKK